MKCVTLTASVDAWASKRVENVPQAGFLLSLSKPFMRVKICNPLTLVALLIALPGQAARLALVMGNDNYASVSKLQKAGNDATAMSRELTSAGFAVQILRGLSRWCLVRGWFTQAGVPIPC
jgi:hypothetical protein